LISREFDRQFEREVTRLAKSYPGAHIIIILRRNDTWVASQYRRYMKNGGQKSFEKFVDLENNQGIWNLHDIYFYPKLLMIRNFFTNEPLVLFHDELKKDPYRFMDKIAAYLGADYQKSRINIRPSHTSYSDKQLKILHKIGKIFFAKEWEGSKNRVIHYIRFRSRWLLCHLILYLAALLPERFAGSDPLIPLDQLEEVHKHFADDWQRCHEFAREFSFDQQR
jgi:hypothetical protein